jgi:hypothetical protein
MFSVEILLVLIFLKILDIQMINHKVLLKIALILSTILNQYCNELLVHSEEIIKNILFEMVKRSYIEKIKVMFE